MRLFVPGCGDRIVLAKDWTFTLFRERRNWNFAEAMGNKEPWNDNSSMTVTLKEGTLLECDRVYIRAFSRTAQSDDDNFDSITWKVLGKKQQRFWAKLKDCNNIEFELPENAVFKERKVAEKVEALSQPQKLDADKVRLLMKRAFDQGGQLGSLQTRAIADFAKLFAESEAVYRQTYDGYVFEKNKYREEARRHGSMTFYTDMHHTRIDSFKPLNEVDFGRRLLTLNGARCKFIKRPDGTKSRRFSWDWYDFNVYSWHYDMTGAALQGLFIDVVSDAEDEKIIGVELCDKRMPKVSK